MSKPTQEDLDRARSRLQEALRKRDALMGVAPQTPEPSSQPPAPSAPAQPSEKFPIYIRQDLFEVDRDGLALLNASGLLNVEKNVPLPNGGTEDIYYIDFEKSGSAIFEGVVMAKKKGELGKQMQTLNEQLEEERGKLRDERKKAKDVRAEYEAKLKELEKPEESKRSRKKKPEDSEQTA